LALDEDHYFQGHPLFAADARALDERFRDPGPLIDLGCGTGRHAIRFARSGFPVVAVDLSPFMLRAVAAKAHAERVHVGLLRANLCDLRCLHDGTFRYALSMFSTLGMIRGSAARRRALAEARRILRPGGRLALHAHNLWLNLRDGPGRVWLLRQLWETWLGRTEPGDRHMTYRGVPHMAVHLFRWGELKRLFREAGFVIEEVLPIDTVTAQAIVRPWFAPGYRAGGWLVFARRPR
jgi:SAM-dependent methyltransferase